MKDTHIEWASHTYNGWEGCTKVSEACERCYAQNLSENRFGRVTWGPGGARRRIISSLNDPIKWNAEAISRGIRYRVFCSSLSDIFDDHPSIQQEWRDHVWHLIRQTEALDWLLLTKRPENIERYLPSDWNEGYPNVCMMVTTENQRTAENRIPQLLKIPARYRALSVEPIIGPVDLTPWIDDLDWVITGGETLTGARPLNPNWMRAIRDLCGSHSVPFLFKQWGWWTPEDLGAKAKHHDYDDGERVYHRGNKVKNGNHLDGVQHLEHPFSLFLR